LKGMGAFPTAKEPHVVWVGARLGDTFYKILSDVDIMLDACSVCYDKKPFKAHVTVGRVRTPSKQLTDLISEYHEVEVGSLRCSEILLMSSKLTPKGAVHSVMDTFRLTGG